jgi:hypothetical protein
MEKGGVPGSARVSLLLSGRTSLLRWISIREVSKHARGGQEIRPGPEDTGLGAAV